MLVRVFAFTVKHSISLHSLRFFGMHTVTWLQVSHELLWIAAAINISVLTMSHTTLCAAQSETPCAKKTLTPSGAL